MIFKLDPQIHIAKPKLTTCIEHHFTMRLENDGSEHNGPGVGFGCNPTYS